MNVRRRLIIGSAIAAPLVARAQSSYPDKPARIVVAYGLVAD